MRHGHAPNAGGITLIRKCAVAVISVECIHLAREISDHQIREAIVVVVCEIDSQPRERMALSIDGPPRYKRNLLERAVALVVIEEFGHGIVGHKEIDASVAVVIRDSYAQAFARLCHANLFRNFGEVTVAIIVVNQWRDGLEVVGMTVRAIAFLMFAAPDVVKVPLQIPKDN